MNNKHQQDSAFRVPALTRRLDRRMMLTSAAALGAVSSLEALLPPWARAAAATANDLASLSGTTFHLTIDRTPFAVNGRRSGAITINGSVPGPLLRWREGDDVTLHVTNNLGEDTSIHWHGILLPPNMDGVPGVSFPGIHAGETFTYRFPVRQAGTYWYHSHSNLQEQLGHYGPLVIDPRGRDPVAFDREYVVVLSDWSFESPHRIFSKLKKMSDTYNFGQRTVGDFVRRARARSLGEAIEDRLMWGRMRMTPTDIADVTGATYTYLVNGLAPEDNWTAIFEPGQRVRLRVINASAMSIFNVRIPGLAMKVVQADGLDVEPVETDEFQIGTAETYDVVVQPQDDRAYSLVAESIDRSGMGVCTLAPRAGMRGEVPPLRERPLLTMKDMGMDHGAMGHDAMGHGEMDHGTMDHGTMDHGTMDHSTMDHGAASAQDPPAGPHAAGPKSTPGSHQHARGPGVDSVPEMTSDRLAERGVGLEDVPHRVLVYSDLRSLVPNPDLRAPERELELHLTSNMERYMWSFDGIKFSEVEGPIVFHEGERLRLTMVNDTMMPHPIHLHGMFFDLVNGQGDHKPRKHTILVKPAEKLSVDITADAVGDWAFHCHLLYHMHAGMFRVVSVQPRHGVRLPAAAAEPAPEHDPHAHHAALDSHSVGNVGIGDSNQ